MPVYWADAKLLSYCYCLTADFSLPPKNNVDVDLKAAKFNPNHWASTWTRQALAQQEMYILSI